ncbi:TetR/AcrR family transcriptional regulator [Rhodococcoides fascians]|uniref:TetR/AcrR family transcriptional regulator n=1 Tax=Rhodococcoides fascians TaxID=1828 RepID=UPI00056D1B2C|nr:MULTISPECIES: TetR/AcrR family transcriptional regulator [Rhodococcus]OZC49995.1 TetR/AcrR family transcriptional regulator [Rhodococcus sp. 06-621-2]
MVAVETSDARSAVLVAADELFYTRGVQAVGMDELRTAAGISLKRMYSLFPSKSDIVAAVLAGRTAVWNERILMEASKHDSPRDKVLSIFDFLDAWFREDNFRGCAFINSFGELGATMPAVADAAHRHKREFVEYVTDLAVEAGCPQDLGLQIALLAEGAQTTAAISESPESAVAAKRAATVLLDAASR